MIKPVISVDQLIRLAYGAGISHGLRIHDEHIEKLATQRGIDLEAEYARDGVSEFNKTISEQFIVDY